MGTALEAIQGAAAARAQSRDRQEHEGSLYCIQGDNLLPANTSASARSLCDL